MTENKDNAENTIYHVISAAILIGLFEHFHQGYF